jgi:hypothetical protein
MARFAGIGDNWLCRGQYSRAKTQRRKEKQKPDSRRTIVRKTDSDFRLQRGFWFHPAQRETNCGFLCGSASLAAGRHSPFTDSSNVGHAMPGFAFVF